METERLVRIFEVLSKTTPESQRRTQAIREGIKRLPEIPAHKELLKVLIKTMFLKVMGLIMPAL